MPTQYKTLSIITPISVAERPHLAVFIGAIAGAWSYVEATLSNQYAMLLFAKRSTQDGGEWIAMEAFENITLFRQKRDMLMSAARARQVSKDTLRRYGSALRDLQETALKRNNVVHGRWGTATDFPDDLIWQRHILDAPGALRYTSDDFKEILDRILRELGELDALFTAEISPHLERLAKVLLQSVLFFEKQRQDAHKSLPG